MRKIAVFAFNGEAMCFMHALLNTLDLHEKGHEVVLVIEGSATKLLPQLTDDSSPLSALYARADSLGLVDCACRACSTKMGTIEQAEAMGIGLCDEMSGHPSMARYIEKGYEIIAL